MKYERTTAAYRKSRRDDADRVDALLAECEKMEDEIDELGNEIIGWENKWGCAIEVAARAENALDEARESLARCQLRNRTLADALGEIMLRWERTNDALFAERALADRLALRLQPLLIATWRETPPTKAELAFAAWEEARK